MARQIVSAHTPLSSDVHQASIEAHPEYGNALLQLQEKDFVVTLYRHPDRPGWLWYIATIEGSPIVGRLDTREHPHSWLSVDHLLLHFGVLPAATKSFVVEPNADTTSPELYSTYSDAEQVYIAVTSATRPVQLHFADEAGTPFYTIERNIFISFPSRDAQIPLWFRLKSQIQLFLMRRGWFVKPSQNTPEEQRMIEEARRRWEIYKK